MVVLTLGREAELYWKEGRVAYNFPKIVGNRTQLFLGVSLDFNESREGGAGFLEFLGNIKMHTQKNAPYAVCEICHSLIFSSLKKIVCSLGHPPVTYRSLINVLIVLTEAQQQQSGTEMTVF